MFEWDEGKSEYNLSKHGVSFQHAVEIWKAPHINVDLIAKSKDGESRNATLGMINGKIYTAIWTIRNDKIRIISVRRARDGEKKIYKNSIFSNNKRDG